MSAMRIGLTVLLLVAMGAAHGQEQISAFRPLEVVVNPSTRQIFATNALPPHYSLEVFDGGGDAQRTVALGGPTQSLALDAASNRVFLVLGGPTSSVVVVDGASATIAKTIILPGFGLRVVTDPSAGKAYVLLDDQLAIIDAANNLTLVPLGTGPSGDLAIDTSSHKVYIVSRDVTQLTEVDGTTNAMVHIALPVSASSNPQNRGMAVNETAHTVLVLADTGRQLAVLDELTRKVTTVALPAVAHRHVAIDSSANRTYIANPVQNALTVVDGVTLGVSTVALNSMPGAVAVNPATGTVYAGLLVKGEVVVLDATTLASYTLTTGTNPGVFAIDVTRNLVYLTHAANLGVIDGNRASAQLAASAGMAVEFYRAPFDHYVLSADPAEIGKLDTRVDWVRTGETFGTVIASGQGTPVCRFYLPPAAGDSHLMMGDPAECAATAAQFPDFVYETADLFREAVPDRPTGMCASGTQPVFRLWNQRKDSNHRYTTNRTIRDALVARGYAAEGYGPDSVSLCAPVPITSTLP